MTNKTNNYIEEVLKAYDKEFTLELKANVEPVFIDAIGSVGPIRYFIEQALLKQREIIKECLPEIMLIDKLTMKIRDDICNLNGFNLCRKQFLDNLKAKGINLE